MPSGEEWGRASHEFSSVPSDSPTKITLLMRRISRWPAGRLHLPRLCAFFSSAKWVFLSFFFFSRAWALKPGSLLPSALCGLRSRTERRKTERPNRPKKQKIRKATRQIVKLTSGMDAGPAAGGRPFFVYRFCRNNAVLTVKIRQ